MTGEAQQARDTPDPAEPAARSAAAPEAIGAYLARQRRLRGIDLDELEQLTRVPRRSLERLEAGSFDDNPDGFVRGFVRTVAAALGLDPDETVMRMLAEPAPGRSGGPRSRRLALLALALAGSLAALALGLGLWRVGAPGARSAGSRPEGAPVALPVRRDPVRALAEAQATPLSPLLPARPTTGSRLAAEVDPGEAGAEATALASGSPAPASPEAVSASAQP